MARTTAKGIWRLNETLVTPYSKHLTVDCYFYSSTGLKYYENVNVRMSTVGSSSTGKWTLYLEDEDDDSHSNYYYYTSSGDRSLTGPNIKVYYNTSSSTYISKTSDAGIKLRTIVIKGGTDVNNSSLISWLENYAEFLGEYDTTATKLSLLRETKAAIKQALIDKGQSPTDVFSSYAQNILAIEVDDGINNPIVVTSDTEMASYLNIDYQGKIIKYTGDTSTYKANTYYRVDNNGEEYIATELMDYPTETETFTSNGTYDVVKDAKVIVNVKSYIEVESESDLPTTATEGTIAIVVGSE